MLDPGNDKIKEIDMLGYESFSADAFDDTLVETIL
jgi:hypothetical protein